MATADVFPPPYSSVATRCWLLRLDRCPCDARPRASRHYRDDDASSLGLITRCCETNQHLVKNRNREPADENTAVSNKNIGTHLQT